MGVWVRGCRGSNFPVRDVGQKKSMSDVGRNFGVGFVCLRCFVKKVLLKVSQNLQKNIIAGVSC